MYKSLYSQSFYPNFAKKNLIASAISKLYFEAVEINFAPQNHLPLQGEKRFQSQRFLGMFCLDFVVKIRKSNDRVSRNEQANRGVRKNI